MTAPTSYPDIELLTSLRYDTQCTRRGNPDHGPLYMLDHHRDRVLEAAEHFGFRPALARYEGAKGLKLLRKELEHQVQCWRNVNGASEAAHGGPFGLRVIFTSSGEKKSWVRIVEPVDIDTLYPPSFPPPPPLPSSSSSRDGNGEDDDIDSSPNGNSSSNNTNGHGSQAERDVEIPGPLPPAVLTGGVIYNGPSPFRPTPSVGFTTPHPTRLLTMDTLPTTSSALTAYKTTRRVVYDDARDRVLPAAIERYKNKGFELGAFDVLMYDGAGLLTETGLASVYFWREGRWVTPLVSVPGTASASPWAGWGLEGDGGTGGDVGVGFLGGQKGTTRRWALEKGFCVEGRVTRESVRIGERCFVSSGIRGFALAVIGEGGGLVHP